MAYGVPNKGAQLSSKKKVSENLCVDQSTVRRTLKLFDTTGLVEKKMYPDNHGGPKLSKADQLHILELVLENPGIYLHELKLELQARGADVHESTICRFLQWANFTQKKMQLIAIQQSEELRAMLQKYHSIVPIC